MFYKFKRLSKKSCLFLLWQKNTEFMFSNTCIIVVQSSLLWQHCAHIIYRTEKTDSREQHWIIPVEPPNPQPPRSRSLWYEISFGVCLKISLKEYRNIKCKVLWIHTLFSFSNKWNLFFFLNLKSCFNHCILYQVFWVISLF